jgi:ankyrin repeat protein
VIAAATFGHLDGVEGLSRAGGSVGLANCYSVTPIEAAVQNSHPRVVRYLAAHGASVNEELTDLACTIGDRAVLEILVESANIDLDRQSLDESEVEIVEYFFEKGRMVWNH